MAVMNMTLAELNTAIRTEMQLDPGLISDEERRRFINDCLSDLGGSSIFEKEVSLNFIDGVATLPDNFVDFIALFRGDTLIRPAKTQSGTAEGFVPRYPQIEVRPNMTETLTLWYTYSPAMLVNSTDRPDIPYGLDNVIVDYAVARAHRKNGNIGLYREYMSAYENKKFEIYQRFTRLENSRVTMILNSENIEDTTIKSTLIF